MTKPTRYLMLALYDEKNNKVAEFDWISDVEKYIHDKGHTIKEYSKTKNTVLIFTENPDIIYHVSLRIKFQDG